MKSKRQEKILEIISKNNIETQEDLITALKNEGYNATQATASRDIRQLKLLKVMVDGVYKYVAPKTDNDDVSEYNLALMSSIRSINYACNNVVLKTNPGLAQAVAAGIDSMNFAEILGCVAGDDTIIVVTVSEAAAVSIVEKIGKISGK
ncbi:MAG: arginine repressor [Clostridia bacterium]|nr:arginine repressor [Clostridia bacterium]